MDHGRPGRVLDGGDEHHRRDGAARRGADGPADPSRGDGLELELPAEHVPGLQAEPQPDGVHGGQLRAREGEPHSARVGPADRYGPAPRAPHRHGHEHPRRALAGAHAQALLAAAAAPRLRLRVRQPRRRQRRDPRPVHVAGVVPGRRHARRAEHRRGGAARRHHPGQQRPPGAACHHRHAHPRLRRPDLRRRHRRLGAGREHHRPGGQGRSEGRHRPLGPVRQEAGEHPLLRRHRDRRGTRLGAGQPPPGLRGHRLRAERPLPRGRGHRAGPPVDRDVPAGGPPRLPSRREAPRLQRQGGGPVRHQGLRPRHGEPVHAGGHAGRRPVAGVDPGGRQAPLRLHPRGHQRPVPAGSQRRPRVPTDAHPLRHHEPLPVSRRPAAGAQHLLPQPPGDVPHGHAHHAGAAAAQRRAGGAGRRRAGGRRRGHRGRWRKAVRAGPHPPRAEGGGRHRSRGPGRGHPASAWRRRSPSSTARRTPTRR